MRYRNPIVHTQPVGMKTGSVLYKSRPYTRYATLLH